jgi:type VI secretion system secreted protein VgrG
LLKSQSIGLAYMQNVGLVKMASAGILYNLNVGLFMKTFVGYSQSTDVGQTISMSAGNKIELVCGSSKIVMTPDAIYLAAKDIHIKGQNTVNIDAPSDVHLNSGTAQDPPA